MTTAHWNHGLEGTLASGATRGHATLRDPRRHAVTRPLAAQHPATAMFLRHHRCSRAATSFRAHKTVTAAAPTAKTARSWVDWDLAEGQQADRRRLALRRAPVLRPDSFATGHPYGGDSLPTWPFYRPELCPITIGPDSRHRTFQILCARASNGSDHNDALIIINANLDDARDTGLADRLLHRVGAPRTLVSSRPMNSPSGCHADN